MELHRCEVRAGEALDGAVVERYVRHFDAVCRLDRVAMVLNGHQHPAAAEVAHRVVRSAVSERELERSQPEREPEQLVAEADAEERNPAEEPADG